MTHTERHEAPVRLADRLAERAPEREARRLCTWIRAAAGRPPLARDPALAAAASSRAQAVGAALGRALDAPDPWRAHTALLESRRALLELRALLYIGLNEGALHKVQFDLLSAQAGRAARSLAAVEERARVLCRASRRPPVPGNDSSRGRREGGSTCPT
ncbi:MAG TPA: hypothetical protein VGQ83_27830 [Polyangia bacterium]|jgi:hypothetical protein